MFAKLSLKSFIYLLTEILSFPDEDVKKIYDKYMIKQTICYHIVTDKDSTSLQFEIISDPSSDIPETRVRDVIVRTKIYNRIDTSQSFWDNFDARKPKRPKKLGL